MKQFLQISIFIGVLLWISDAGGQNLVPNPGFEQISDCDLYFDDFDKAIGWKGYHFTPDIFNVCGENFFLKVPNNVFDTQIPASGKGYAGILTYHKEYEIEIIGAKLQQPLQKNEQYEIRLKVSRAKAHARYASNNIGVLFTNEPEKSYQSFQAHLNIEEVVEESDVWYTISGIFVADDMYQYITIGNFFDKENTKLRRMKEGSFDAAYYFIDDVYVAKAPKHKRITLTKKTEKGKTVVTSATPKANPVLKGEDMIPISISGIVFDAGSQEPLAAIVDFTVLNTRYKKKYETDYSTGTYSFAGVRSPDKFTLQISARNYYTITQVMHRKGEKVLKKNFYLHPLKAGESIRLDNIVFLGAELTSDSFPELNRLVQVLKDNPLMKIELTGFTDDRSQIELAKKRATAIQKYLIEIGQIDQRRLQIQSRYQDATSYHQGNAAHEHQEVERVEFKILN